MRRFVLRRTLAALTISSFLIGGVTAGAVAGPLTPAAQVTSTYSCDAPSTMSTPTADMDMGGMDHGMAMPESTASASSGQATTTMPMEFDLHYIDMMIPHHESIIALAQVALPTLTDPRLQEMAQNIITNQGSEIEELRNYREAWYGSPDPLPMDDAMLQMMMSMMPTMASMSSMEQMATEMDARAQVDAFCSAANPDLAFIDLTIPHHQMAIAASQDALTMATHQELKDFAQKVIDAQQQELDELMQIRSELTGESTPAA